MNSLNQSNVSSFSEVGRQDRGVPESVSSWIFCNVCMQSPSEIPNCKLYLGSCLHVFCSSCLAESIVKGPEGSNRNAVLCKICEKHVAQVTEVNNASVKALFMDPDELMKSCVAEVEATTRFQEGQTASFAKIYDYMSQQNDSMKKFCASVSNKNKELEKQAQTVSKDYVMKEGERRQTDGPVNSRDGHTTAANRSIRVRENSDNTGTPTFNPGAPSSSDGSSFASNSCFTTPRFSTINTSVVNEMSRMTCNSVGRSSMPLSARLQSSKANAKESAILAAFQLPKSEKKESIGGVAQSQAGSGRPTSVAQLASTLQARGVVPPRKRTTDDRLYHTAPAKKTPQDYMF